MTERTFWMGEQSLKALNSPLVAAAPLRLSPSAFPSLRKLVNPVTPRAPLSMGVRPRVIRRPRAAVGCRTRAREECDACPPRGDVAPLLATVPLRISCVHSSPVGALTRTQLTMRHTLPPSPPKRCK